MKRGRKPIFPSEAKARGTYRPDRHAPAMRATTTAPDWRGSEPIRPDWLTSGGEKIWADTAPLAYRIGFLEELDSTAFGNFCNLFGWAIEQWQAGAAPKAATLRLIRLMAADFGLAGELSRRMPGASTPRRSGPP